jgi:hypothetical protein
LGEDKAFCLTTVKEEENSKLTRQARLPLQFTEYEARAQYLKSTKDHESNGQDHGAAAATKVRKSGQAGGGKEEVGKGEEAEKGRAGVGGGKSSYHTLVFQVCGFWLGSTCGLGVEGDGARRCLA